jgi:2-polyprenyl-3-methyl-5-hydroxy-6-metoxy-1,4-benzoquinol methylase
LDFEDDSRYFTRLAASFVRGRLKDLPDDFTDEQTIAHGLKLGLKLHKFKRNTELARVKKVLGVLQGLNPSSLLDIGSGRGTFLFPLLDTLDWLPVFSIELNSIRARDIHALRVGGIENINAAMMSATEIGFDDKAFDVVTALEVLEHMPEPQKAAREIIRVAGKFVVASVPSKEDDNPEHIHLFDKESFTKLFIEAGAQSVKIDYVLNHMIAVVKV